MCTRRRKVVKAELKAAGFKRWAFMIKVTTLDKREIAINAELIERVESVPETVITLTNGKKILVTQSMDEIIEKVMAYRRNVACSWWRPEEGK